MPKKAQPECISDCFDLYLKYNGSNFPAIQKEMREKGWHTFTSQNIRKKIDGEYVGWESELGWQNALAEINANRGRVAMTSAEGLHHEVESVRKTIYDLIKENGVRNPENKWLLWEHGKYVKKTTEILSSMGAARDNYANFVFFLKHMLRAATNISPDLARALCEAEDPLLDWAEKTFVTEEEKANG